MDKETLKKRTKEFGLRIIRLVEALPQKTTEQVIGKQLLRAGTSVGANYRAACRARSKAEFVAKLGIVLEEADECGYWLEMIQEAGLLSGKQTASLHKEADELSAIIFSTIRTTKNAKS